MLAPREGDPFKHEELLRGARNNSFTVVAEAAACSDQSCVVKTHEGRDLPGSS